MSDARAHLLASIRGTLSGLDEAERRTEHLMASNTEYPPLTEKQREAIIAGFGGMKGDRANTIDQLVADAEGDDE